VLLTRRPTHSTESHIQRLSSLGWSDEAILQAVHIVGFFNYYTRLVEALGCDPEDFMSATPDPPERSNS